MSGKKHMWKFNDSNSVIYHNELVISTLCEDFKFEVIYFFTISSCITLPHDSNKRELFSSEVFYCKFVITQAFTEFSTQILHWSSLIYNTSDTSDTSETRATPLRTSATRVQHKCYTNDTSAKQAEKFDFDNDTSKNIISHPYIYYMASERLQGEQQFNSKNYLLEMPRFHSKMRLKNAPQKLNF